MTNKRIILNEQDYKSLTLLINKLKTTHRLNTPYMRELGEEMERAKIGKVNDPNMKNVTLKSRVTYQDLENGGAHVATIVFPAFADSAKDLYSILSPLGTALIGEAVGNITTCYAPSGEIKLKILEIEHPQPGGE
ncbi:transcription elongation factor GreAB [Oceanispirochaeta crateris]|uniref:Transcription elongation factor GreAB n=1 Tax=Oceanispirochaeta crateris TaxID=2518645 RepID=A0A5C1QQP2_9SPIO|nr:GreA/GreB family elongation factor [Oceanispirochaeta crateris]QEN08934.1 transcription elongation factor GreAB [Oceanispirochaeta crateris]